MSVLFDYVDECNHQQQNNNKVTILGEIVLTWGENVGNMKDNEFGKQLSWDSLKGKTLKKSGKIVLRDLLSISKAIKSYPNFYSHGRKTTATTSLLNINSKIQSPNLVKRILF